MDTHVAQIPRRDHAWAGLNAEKFEVIPLFLLAVASMLHAIYAHSGNPRFQQLAWVIWALIAIAAVIVLMPVLGPHL